MSNNIYRGKKDSDHPYKALCRATLEDSRLSFEARGVLAYILVKPDDWRINITDLMRQGDIGRDKAYRIINELIACGYCRRIELREKGRIVSYNYEVFEEPLTEKPYTVKPETEKPCTENQYHTKKEKGTKQENPTKKEKARADLYPSSGAQAQPPAVNGFGTRLDDPRIVTEDCPSRLQANSYQQPARDPAQPPPTSTYFDPRKIRNGTIEPGAGTTAVEIVLEYVPFNANTFSAFVCRTLTEQVTDFAKWREVMAQTTLKGFAPHNLKDRLEIYANGWKARPETGKLLREPTNDNRNQLSAAAEADLRERLRAKRAAAAARNAQLANQRPISPA